MIFSSTLFLFIFLPVTLLVYYLIPAKHLKIRNIALLCASLISVSYTHLIPDDGPSDEIIIVGNLEITLELIEDHRVAWAKVRIIEEETEEESVNKAESERFDKLEKAEKGSR